MKGVGAFFKKWSKNIIVSLICTFMLCAGIGYAQITRPLNITGNVDVSATEGIFITDAVCERATNVSTSAQTVGEFYSTILNGRVALHSTNTSSYVVFTVTLRNNYDYPYRFNKIDKITEIYTNEQIDCVASFPDGTDIVQPRSFITVDLTFKYIENPDLTISNHRYADICVNIDFNIYVQPVLADNMVPVEYNNDTASWDTANEDSFNYADYDSGVWANAITYDHSKIYSQNEHTTNGGTVFNGENYYIDYRHENYDFNSSLSIAVRFKWVGVGDGTVGYLMCNLQSGGFGLFVVHNSTTISGQSASPGQIGFVFVKDDGTEVYVLSNTVVPIHTWATVAVTYDGSNVKIYIDGTLDKTEAVSGDIKVSPVGINIGCNPNTDTSQNNLHLKGNVSHVLLLNDILTADEVNQVYSNRFDFPTADRNEIFNLDITTRDSNGKYFDGKYDGGYNLGLAGENFINSNDSLTHMSIAVKFCVYTFGTSGYQYLACCLETQGYGLGFTNANKQIYFTFYNSETGGLVNYTSEANVLEAKKWYNLVVTVDGYNVCIYLNGRLLNSTVATANGASYTMGTTPIKFVTNSKIKLTMGGNPDSNNEIDRQWYNGWIKECVVFKKGLTEDEVTRDFSTDFAFHYKKYSTKPSKTQVAQFVKYDYDNITLKADNAYTEDGIVLNGVDDYVCVGLGNHNFSTSLTAVIRLKFPTVPTNAQALISNMTATSDTITQGGFQLMISDGHFSLRAKIRVDGAIKERSITASDFAIQADTWYTISVVINSTGLHLFIDGAKVAYLTEDITLANSMHPIFVGAHPAEGGYSGCSTAIVSNYVFLNQAVEADVITQFFSGEISPSLARANCFLNFVGYEYRTVHNHIPQQMITGFYTWIPRFKIKSVLDSGEVDIEIVTTSADAHDAFTFNGTELEGLWFSKFENSIDERGNIRTIANADIYNTDNISTMFNKISQIATGNSGFSSNTYSMLDIHMSKNSEWGAMAYFAQSKYGLFRTGELATIASNNTSIAGNNYQTNTNQSTTQNITGIYDIVGGANEYVMANYDGTIGSSGFTSLPSAYYYNVYTTLSSYYNNTLYHAMGEIDSYQPDANSTFVTSSTPWLVRTGLFDYSASDGSAGYSSRTVIAIVR